jgi:hypothetical protein
LKEEIDNKCQLCKQHEETTDHPTTGCPILAKNEYLMEYNKVCAHLLFSICKALGTETTNGTHTLYTDQTTDTTQKTRIHVL